MTRVYFADEHHSKNCICNKCGCGGHKYFHKNSPKLPLTMQLELRSKEFENRESSERKAKAFKANKYGRSTYNVDYCSQQGLIDKYALELEREERKLKLHAGDFAGESTYNSDYNLPWSRQEREMSRGEDHVPGHLLVRVPKREPSWDEISPGFYNYYLPDEETKENCPISYKDKLSMGRPFLVEKPTPDKPRESFEKFGNYWDGTISPRRGRREYMGVEETPFDTYYENDFICPRDWLLSRYPIVNKWLNTQDGTLKVGDGPMEIETTTMHDFQDPHVSTHHPIRHPHEVYERPHCAMETTTTTGRDYPEWK